MAENQNSGANLTDVAYISRRLIKFGAITLVALIVGRTAFTAFTTYWKATHPAPPPEPTVGFGILPALIFSEKTATDKPTSYKLETATGGFPDFPDRANVYLMHRSIASLLDDENGKRVASSFGFVFAPESIGSEKYRFAKSDPLESTFQINVRSLWFDLETDFLSRPELLLENEVVDQTRGVAVVKSALSAAQLLPEDVATASGESVYLKALGDELTPALSFSDADYLRVDLNRNPIQGQYKGYTVDGNLGAISAILSGSFSGIDSIVRMTYQYQQIDYSYMETYPLRPVKSAWQLLQSGEGYVAKKGDYDTAVVRTVSLGYYEAPEEQEYYQPIYIFEGDGGFMGFIPAVDPKYYQSASQ